MNSSIILESGIATFDQALLSLMNFLISLSLIKFVTKEEYGYYSIFFAIMLFIISVQNAVVNTPLTVLLPGKQNKEKKRYLASLCWGQFLIIIPFAILVLVGIVIAQAFGVNKLFASVAATLTIAIGGILLREYIRTVYFAERQPLQVLKIDLFYVLFFILMNGLIWWLFSVRVGVIFISMGVCSLVASSLFIIPQGWRFHLSHAKESYAENWAFGKWALLGVVVTHLQNYCYIYFLGLFLGSKSVADVSAARVLLMPLALLQQGWNKISIPFGSKLREQNKIDVFFRVLIVASFCIALLIVLYVFMLKFVAIHILEQFLTQKYQDSLQYMVYFMISFVFGYFRLNAMNGLIVLKRFSFLTKVNTLTMLITIGCTYFLVQSYGARGALVAIIIGEALLGSILWFYFRMIKSNYEGSKN